MHDDVMGALRDPNLPSDVSAECKARMARMDQLHHFSPEAQGTKVSTLGQRGGIGGAMAGMVATHTQRVNVGASGIPPNAPANTQRVFAASSGREGPVGAGVSCTSRANAQVGDIGFGRTGGSRDGGTYGLTTPVTGFGEGDKCVYCRTFMLPCEVSEDSPTRSCKPCKHAKVVCTKSLEHFGEHIKEL
jgi:hypothetical protein